MLGIPSTFNSGDDVIRIDNVFLSPSEYTSNCILDINQPQSFDSFGIYRQELFQRSLTAAINKDSQSFILHPPSTDLSLSPSPAAPIPSLRLSLTEFYANNYDEMTTLAAQPPGSPPGLTGSKSSKSSSFHSSSSSSGDGISFDTTNFEDIGLEEDVNQDCHGHHNKRLSSKSTSATRNGSIGAVPTIMSMRELTNGSKRPPYLYLQTQFRPTARQTPAHSLVLPRGPNPKRGFTSPSAPSLAMTAMSNLSRSRSPSPPQSTNPTVSHPIPQRTQRLSPRPRGLSPTMVKSPTRRQSWQPSQKTVKELEDEYDDLDEELPEDANLWNVPLSPRPCNIRSSISAANSTNVSPSTSPERSGSLRSPSEYVSVASLPLTSTLPPQSNAQSSFDVESKIQPTSPSRLNYPRGVSTGIIPDNFYFPKTRSKTWDVAMSELSEEAKNLTEALENHAESFERQKGDSAQNSHPSGISRNDKLSRAKTNPSKLLPLRTNNVMIDPLPASKEKEKVLSRTRPSWLPPKDRKEEKKHLREYQRMMALSLEADKRKAAKAVDAQCAQDDTKNALLRIWEEHVLPNWDQVIREPRTRELWWRGVAPRSRAQVWEKTIGNDLALTEMTYVKALQRAKDMEARFSKARPGERFIEMAWFDAIRRDTKAVFPDLKIFQPGGPLYDGLVDVLMAYSMYRSDVGYCHGTHLIAALLSLTFPTPTRAFLALANILNRPLPLAFLTGDPTSMQKAYTLILSLLATKVPRLYTHLFSQSSGLGLSPHEILEPMIRTLFLSPGQGLGVEIASRVWDVMILDGDAVVMRTAVAVLAGLEGKLYGTREEVLGMLGWGGKGGLRAEGDEVESFMEKVRAAGKEKGRSKMGKEKADGVVGRI